MRQADWPVVEVHELQRLRQPAFGAEVSEHALGNQHGAERDRNHQDRRDRSLVARLVAHAEGNRQRQRHVDDRHRKREIEGGVERAPQMAVGEELGVVGEPVALRRLEGQDQPVEERVDEKKQHEYHCRRDEDERAHYTASAGYTSTRSGGTLMRTASPSAADAGMRACSSTPEAVRTSTSESRPQYSTASMRPARLPAASSAMSSGRIAAMARRSSGCFATPSRRSPLPPSTTALPLTCLTSSSSTLRYPMKRATWRFAGCA